jgi:hypothetical protein
MGSEDISYSFSLVPSVSSRAESLFGSEGGLDNGASPSATLTFAAEVRDAGLDKEFMNLGKKCVTGWTSAGFFARDDLINEGKSMMVREGDFVPPDSPVLAPTP